jgi:hypothetical protein
MSLPNATATLPSPSAAADAVTLAPTEVSSAAERAAVPGYEILGELGRGGMGVVYKARHLGLNRLVALKMILAGGHAGPDELARFRGEAEAVARLNHPNIVQIHDVGESGGLPYFSLEFVEGGSLDRKLNGTPLPADEAAKLVETLARAMAAAHVAGLVHRDLKPANVLLGADGTPKVTDFGLAKKLDTAGQTASGAVMGTPSYMAPEQAGGKSREIGPLTDVYALGAILYECLTGRPPFKAATPLDTILQVVSEEPVPPTKLNTRVPVDLETICLKCLQKEPSKRYASAGELVEDLRRFQNGETIAARPAGMLERAGKWAMRRPAAAALLAVSVFATLTVLGVFSTAAAMVYDKNRELSEANVRLTDERNRANSATKDAEQSSKELRESRDDLEKTLARSLLRPLALRSGAEPMTEPEWGALWELAINRRGRLGYRFVEEASRSPATSRQLRDRADLALHAAVGLDEECRAEVESLLLTRLADRAVGGEQKKDLALALAAWDGLSSPGAVETARELISALSDSIDPNDLHALGKWSQGMSAVAARMGPKEAAQVAVLLTLAMKDPKNASSLLQLTQRLPALAARMEPREATQTAAQAATALVQSMRDPKHVSIAGSMKGATTEYALADGLSVVAPFMDPKEAAQTAAQAAAVLTEAIKGTKDGNALQSLSQGISSVAARLEPKRAAEAAVVLIQAMSETTDPTTLQRLVQGLSSVAARLEPRQAAEVAANLAQAIHKATHPFVLRYLSQGLSAVAARLEPKRAATVLTQAMQDPKNVHGLQPLAQGLSETAALEPKEATLAAAAIIQAMQDPKNVSSFTLPQLAQGLSAVASRLEPTDAAQAAAVLTQARKRAGAMRELWEGLSAVTARMEPNEAAAVLIQAMSETTDAYDLHGLAQGLSAVAFRLEPRDAEEAAKTVIQAMSRAAHPTPVKYLGEGLSALAMRLEPKDAAAVLIQALKGRNNVYASLSLARGLSALAVRMEPREAAATAAQAAAAITEAMQDPKNVGYLQNLGNAFSMVAAHMGTKEAEQAAAQAAAIVTGAMKDPKNASFWKTSHSPYPVQGLSVVAARMEPREAVAVLTLAMKDIKDPSAMKVLGEGLAALVSRMKPKEAAEATAEAAGVLTRAMKDTKEPHALMLLAQGLSAVAGRRELKETAEAIAVLTRAMTEPINRGNLQYLAQGLSALAAHMEPREAAQAAALLTQAMQDPRNASFLPQLAHGLSTVVARLGASATGQAATTIIRSLQDSKYFANLNSLERDLSTVLSPVPAEECPPRSAMASAALAFPTGIGHPETVLALLIPAAEVPACPLSTQQLVELLKMPTCSGPPQRIILNHLGNRYRRCFANVWEFVSFAKEQNLGLDFTTPPRSPEVARNER